MIERAGQGCAIGSALFERIHQPYINEGQRTGAFRFGDSRAMALAGATVLMVHAVNGFTNKSLPGWSPDCSARLQRQPDDLRPPPPTSARADIPSPAPTPTSSRRRPRVAVFYTKLRDRLLQPLLVAQQPAGTRRASSGPRHDRPCCRRLRHERETWEGGMKLVTRSRDRNPKESYASPETRFARSGSGAPSGQSPTPQL